MNHSNTDIDPYRIAFVARCLDYQVAADAIRRMGYDGAMEVARWCLVTGHKDEEEAVVDCQIDLTNAIHQGMSLGEHLEYFSPRSWLDRQQQGGAA